MATKRRLVALVRALAIVVASLVIARGPQFMPRAHLAVAAIVVGHAAKAEPARPGVVVTEQAAAPDLDGALPTPPAAVAVAAIAGLEDAPSASCLPRANARELTPIARGPPRA